MILSLARAWKSRAFLFASALRHRSPMALSRARQLSCVLAIAVCAASMTSQAQMAGDGLPWINGNHNGDNPNQYSCAPTMNGTDCSSQIIAILCQANPGSGWCMGATTQSCVAQNNVSAGCTVSLPGYPNWGSTYIITAQPTPQFYVNTHSMKAADCGSCNGNPNKNNNANKVGEPINPSNGDLYDEETDVPAQAGSPESAFMRFYNSADLGSTDMGVGWRHSFSREIISNAVGTPYQPYFSSDPRDSNLYEDPQAACVTGWGDVQATSSQWSTATASYTAGLYAGGTCSLSINGAVVAIIPVYSSTPFAPGIAGPAQYYTAVRDDGQFITFSINGSTLTPPVGATLQLTQTGTGFTLTDDQDNVETYNTAGQLLTVTTRGGIVYTATYNSSSQLSTVTDSFGHQLSLSYNTQNQLASVTAPSGAQLHYAYNSQGSLSAVTKLDSTSRSYVYENTSFPTNLTGVIDESSTRYSTWGYDAQGRGDSTQEAGGVDEYSLTFNSNGTVSTTDALGAARTFTYQIIGNQNRVTSISGYQCPTCSESAATTYDSNGFIASRTDYNGNLTCYANDSVRGLELVRVEGFGPGTTCPSSLASYTPQSGTPQRKITTQWSSTWHEPSLITETNRTTGFTFDASGNVLTKTVTDTTVSPNVSRTWTYTYNGYGQVLTAKGPRTDLNSTTTYSYYSCSSGSQCGQLQTVTDAIGDVTTYGTYNTYGQPLTITDPNGVVTTLTYDALQRLSSRQVGTELTSFSYYPTGVLKQVTLPDNSYVLYTYDNAHRLTKISDGAGNSIQYTLDVMGNRTTENTYDPSGVLHRTHSWAFNTLNQLYKDVSAAGTSAVTTTYAYDSNGNQTAINAPLSRNTSNAFDSLNRLAQITDPNSGNTSFSYDPEDDLTSVKDPRSLTTTYGYNGFGDVTQLTSPDTGVTQYTYDSAGNLATATDARSAVSTYTYDAANRITSAAFKSGSTTDLSETYTYDQGTDGKGRLTGVSDANYSLAWTYDFLGRVVSKKQTIGSVNQTASYTYTNGDLTAITTPSGQTITYGYNTNHQVTSVSINGTTLLNAATYEPLGAVNGWTWGNSSTEVRAFNTDGNLYQVNAIEAHTYSYDNALRISGIANNSNSSLSWTYGYDALDHVTSAVQSGTSRGWTYDADGNLATYSGGGTYTVSTTSNQMTSRSVSPATSYTYDAAGNVLTYSSPAITFTYYNDGRMKSAQVSGSTTIYVYNALGQRIEKTGGPVGTILFFYDEAGHMQGEYSSTGALDQETVWLGDTPVATIRPNGSTVAVYYIHADHMNAPRMITQPSTNAIAWRWDTGPYGAQAPNQNPAGLGTFIYGLRFPGQYYDSETGLNYNYFRDYDPAVGRYVESDPIGLSGGSYSTYVYAEGNPVSHVDPSGEFAPLVVPAAEAAISAGEALITTVGGAIAWYEAQHCKQKRCKDATPENIRVALQQSKLKTLNVSVSAAVVQAYVDSIEAGNQLAGIKVDGDVIVDGNHRYIAALLCNMLPPTRPGTKPLSAVPIPIQQLRIEP